ncbi:MAG TPA: amino acid ABC transporter substrate-binding protein, partial [Chloroflexi bacterium]|nr:amino acid ABC transporter substrate-binding protein [Chloroflexota bacterium]
MTRKQWVLIGLLIALALIVTACGGASSAAPAQAVA